MNKNSLNNSYPDISRLISGLSSGNKQGLAYQFLNVIHAKDKERFLWLLDRFLAANYKQNKEKVREIISKIEKIDLDFTENLINLGHAIILGILMEEARK